MRLLIRTVIAIVVALVLVVGGLLLLPGEKIAGIAADQVEAQTGRKLSFDGKVKISLWPVLGVKTGPVELSNADWAGADAPPMLRASGLSIGVAAAELLTGEIRVKEITVNAPVLHLSTREDGQGNWVFGEEEVQTAAPSGEGTGALPLAVERIRLRDASLTYAAFGAVPFEQNGVDLELRWPDPAGVAELDLTLRPAGGAVEIEAEIGRFSQFLAGEVASVGATLRTGDNRARFDGRASIAGDVAGRVTADLKRTGEVMQAAGLEDPGLPQGMGQAVILGTDLTYTTDGRLALRDLDLQMDQNRLTGAADVVLGAVPQVTAQLQAGDLDFSSLAAGGAADGQAGSSQAGWPKDPIDASALGLMNGSIDLSVQSLDTGGVKLGPSKLNLTIDRARGVLAMSPMSVFGGSVTGQLVANNRNGLSVGGKLNASDIQLRQALGQLADIDTISGTTLAQIEFLGVGNDMDTIMRSLSGKGWFEIGKGFFTGFDLEALMRSGNGNGGSTVFDSLTASFTMKGGNLDNQDLLLLLKSVRAEGKGRIGLGAQDLDYLFTPQVSDSSGQGLRIPVRIKGSWWDPSIRPDLGEALEADIEAKKDELEARAKAKAKEKLEAELETTITDGQDVEEVIKDRLEQKAKDGLLKLLGGD